MADSEFYSSQENWPQPPDDSCTLEPVVQSKHGEKKKTKSATSAKMKKKMSESLAGVTAAAVAVVMLSTSIPALKDAFDDFPELPEFIGDGEICSVCNDEECPFYSDGLSGLVISLGSEAEYLDEDDLYSMAGFTDSDLLYDSATYPCIPMETGERAILRLDEDLRHSLPILDDHETYFHFNTYSGDEADYAYTGKMFYGIDEKDPMSECFLYVVLVYSTGGDVPLMDPTALSNELAYMDIDPQSTKCRTFKVPDYPQLEVQFFSNMDEDALDSYTSLYEVFVVTDEYQQYALGQTMLFTESDFTRRTFADYEYWGLIRHYGFNTDGEDEYHVLDLDFRQKEYSLSMAYQIVFTPVGWKAVFDRWRDLNEQAEETGHGVYFPIEEFSSITVNNIEYSCYAVYSAASVDDVNDYPWIWYYFVPKQEGNIAILDHRSISPEDLQRLLESMDPNEVIAPEDILNHITLR